MRRWLLHKILRVIKIWCVGFIEQAGNIFYDHMYDKRLGIETMEFVPHRDNLSKYKDATIYEPTPYRKLEKIFSSVPMSANDIFIDLGCGKGRIILLAATKKIRKVIGVELNVGIANVAEENLKKMKIPHVPVEIIQIDSTQYKFSNETIIYMYNPFGSRTILEIMNNIKSSLTKNPRNVRIIYSNARYSDILDSQDWLAPMEVPFDGGFLVWGSKG